MGIDQAWCGDPCTWSSHGSWYDTVFATTYYSHFVVGLSVAVALWLRNRDLWLPYMRRYIGLNLLALACYIAYPLAPPWWAGSTSSNTLLRYADGSGSRCRRRPWTRSRPAGRPSN